MKFEERPSKCENPDAECYREPVAEVFWVEDHRDNWIDYEKWLCDPCLQAMIRGYGASEMPNFTHYGELIEEQSGDK